MKRTQDDITIEGRPPLMLTVDEAGNLFWAEVESYAYLINGEMYYKNTGSECLYYSVRSGLEQAIEEGDDATIIRSRFSWWNRPLDEAHLTRFSGIERDRKIVNNDRMTVYWYTFLDWRPDSSYNEQKTLWHYVILYDWRAERVLEAHTTREERVARGRYRMITGRFTK